MNRIRRWLMRFLQPELEARMAEQRQVGYAIGFAHGELRGRMALADEIAVIHGVEGGDQPLGFEQAKLIKARQVH